MGHVFQDRYKSEAIEQVIYLLEAIRYVHNNPVKARLVAEPKKYPWSSFPLYLDCSSYKSGLIACSEILEMYWQNRKSAVQRMIEYTCQKDNNDFLDIELKEAREDGLEVVIKSFLQEKNIDIQGLRKDKEFRDELILILKESAGYPIRKIAEALGLDRNVVQRTSKE
ncbi:hypothetical protein [Geosporobacter ferrireducens]|uniref:Transposase n=1 Tax=Geosporobacter ferrireducens TaxID=1424294 RepID=A0A1D8GI30_9FIRM|nr:hypothetical protein [Geosporobacter ferrireducens]AOT70557.1 hypothetical protein Gferi_13835 [Geosporobacter ferrireducens]